ncbi:MAG: cell envelope integrity protein CreD [Pseudomonadota bacterium]
MPKSIALNALIVGFLVLLMSVPLLLVSDVIKERAEYSRETKLSLGQEWGGAQSHFGISLEIPVTAEVTRIETRSLLDPDTGEELRDDNGARRYRQLQLQETVNRPSLYLLPNDYAQSVAIRTEERKRGLFKVPVYRGTSSTSFTFDLEQIEAMLTEGETANFDAARILVGLNENRSLRGEIRLQADKASTPFEPRTQGAGLVAEIGDPRGIETFATDFSFNGAQALNLAAIGRANQIDISGDWPHPSFQGHFLPDEYQVTDAGFSARWSIPNLARPVPQVSRELQFERLQKTASFGVSLLEPNDFYQKAYRSARYGILFIGLTFLTILLLDARSDRPVHAIQYIMIGLAEAIFVLLLAALSEQIGFSAAYAIASAATIALISAYAVIGLKFGWRVLTVTGTLSAIYSILFFILHSQDTALLSGSILSFVALAAMMYVTRNENWSLLGKAINDATTIGETSATKQT